MEFLCLRQNARKANEKKGHVSRCWKPDNLCPRPTSGSEVDLAKNEVAFFGYRKVIEAFRDKHAKALQSTLDPDAASVFAHVAYTELQDVAIRWHEIRHKEKKVQDERIEAADKVADSIRRGVKSGVTPKAKNPLD